MPHKDPNARREYARKQAARYRAANPEKARTYQREWRRKWRESPENREKAKQVLRSSWQRHRCKRLEEKRVHYQKLKLDQDKWQKLRSYKQEYSRSHPPVLSSEKKHEYNQRAYYKYRDKILAQKKSIYVPRPRRKKDVEGAKLWKREYHAKRKGAPGTCTPDQWRSRIVYYGNCCAYCHIQLNLDTVSVDHVKPTVADGSNWPANLVPACLSCNRKKNRKRWVPHPVWAVEGVLKCIAQDK